MMSSPKPQVGQLLTVVFPDGETEEHPVEKVMGQFITCCGIRFHFGDDKTSDTSWECDDLGFIAYKVSF